MNILTNNYSKTHFHFGTKAETLSALKPLVSDSLIPDLYYFNVSKWHEDSNAVIEKIKLYFKNEKRIAIRSSAQGEDGCEYSMAGAFHSCLNIDILSTEHISNAVKKVIESYPGDTDNQILAQAMVTDIAVSGVIMTRNLEDGAPYYVLNYDDNSGKTDLVTGGRGVHKTVFISRSCDEKYIKSERVKKMLELAKEVERLCDSTHLDIEFGISRDNKVYIFQVRPISVYKNWHPDIEKRVLQAFPIVEQFVLEHSKPRRGICGNKTILATMPDWNPAEMIGVTPRPLATSLYRELITKRIWQLARSQMGYKDFIAEELMVVIIGRPYIDVRNSFNSFLPKGLDDSLACKIVNGWVDRLNAHPELHDKVEFEIAQTCVDFMFDKNFESRYQKLFNSKERKIFKEALSSLTKDCLDLNPTATLSAALQTIDTLAERQRTRSRHDIHGRSCTEILREVHDLIEECKSLGTLPFSIIARHAFIAESFLKSAVDRKAISQERVNDFKMSTKTITHQLAFDIEAICKKEMSKKLFLERYGHLRPGTYDITSLRYDDRNELFQDCSIPKEEPCASAFALTERERRVIDRLLKEIKMNHIDANGLFEYARRSITGREYGKFVFTRNISDALEDLVQWGLHLKLDRDNLSFLDIDTILDNLTNPIGDTRNCLSKLIESRRKQYALSNELKLSYIIRDTQDVYVVPLHRSAPNFIGSERIEAQIILVDVKTPVNITLQEKIVCIENADPGFDWIFTKGIRALITKYGGANSHMAIRCAEFGLSAAIGCGEDAFNRIIKAGTVELNCDEKILRPLRHD